jgi:hypothetical protein
MAFILFDAGFLVLDAARLAFNRCSFLEKDLQRQLAIDAGALALDLVFLALPGATGGGTMLRGALAGTNFSIDVVHAASALQAGIRTIQSVVKVVQVGTQTQTTANFFSNCNGDQYNENRHKEFSESLKTMKDSNLRKTIRSLERRINEHLEKIAQNPASRDFNHWQSELRTFQEELDLTIQ